MSRRILLCVETNPKARTDYQYINETIRRFYENDTKISYKLIYHKNFRKTNIEQIVVIYLMFWISFGQGKVDKI